MVRDQRCVDFSLRAARFGRGHQFGPRKVGFEKVVRKHQAAVSAAVEQMVAARKPEVARAVQGIQFCPIGVIRTRSSILPGAPFRLIFWSSTPLYESGGVPDLDRSSSPCPT